MSLSLAGETVGTAAAAPGENPEAAAPDFAREWEEIRERLESEAAGALRIGQLLITIKDGLPRGRWLPALREHGMSQPQASRYMRYARLPESDREIFQRRKGFSLSAAVGERRKKDAPVEGSGEKQAAAPIPPPERDETLAEIDRQFKLALDMVDFAEENFQQEREWAMGNVADDIRALIREGLKAKLRARLLPEGAPWA
jgi:hypothetical protein